MILHERKLILDPDVFSGITSDMLKELEKMGAMAAVQVLTGHMVRALKERRAKSKVKDKNAKKAAKAAKKTAATVAAASSASPAAASAPANTDVLDATGTPPSPPTVPVVPDATSSTPPREDLTVDPGSPIIVIDDSEDEAPAAKRRKLNDSGMNTVEMISMVA
jgi:hypothetical protein